VKPGGNVVSSHSCGLWTVVAIVREVFCRCGDGRWSVLCVARKW
jgi:hypothetical protein